MLSNVEKFLHMTDVKKSKIYPVFFQSTLFCCNLRNLRNSTLRKIKLKVVYVESFGQLKKFVLKSFIATSCSRFREFFLHWHFWEVLWISHIKPVVRLLLNVLPYFILYFWKKSPNPKSKHIKECSVPCVSDIFGCKGFCCFLFQDAPVYSDTFCRIQGILLFFCVFGSRIKNILLSNSGKLLDPCVHTCAYCIVLTTAQEVDHT